MKKLDQNFYADGNAESCLYEKRTEQAVRVVVPPRSLSEMKHAFDPSEYGGSQLLGIAKPVIKAHGSSDAKAFKNAILQAIRYAESGVSEAIADAVRAK